MMVCKTIVPVALLGLMLSGCGGPVNESASSPGPDGKRSYAATGFTGVKLAGSEDVIVREGAAFSVVATGSQKALDRLVVEVVNGILVVRHKKSGFMNWNHAEGATVNVTMPKIDRAEVTGSGRMDVDHANGDAVTAELAGSGDLSIARVTAKSVDLSLAGSGDLAIKGGTAGDVSVSLAGAGDIDASGLTAASADVSLMGSGDIDLTATSRADVSLAGSGDVKVRGGAKCNSSEIGSGKLICG